jgi:hypothetical protein
VPRLCELYAGICLTAKEKARNKLQSGYYSVILLVSINLTVQYPLQNNEAGMASVLYDFILASFKLSVVQTLCL